jgi:hypothetical protein
VQVIRGVLGDRAELLGALALVIGNTTNLRSLGLVPLGRERHLSTNPGATASARA